MPFLRVHHEDGSTTVFELTAKPVLIGRQPDCDLVVPIQNVSRRHASISPEGATFVLRDEGSTLGTTVNGAKATELVLEQGDEIRIGGCTLVYETGSTPARARPGPSRSTVPRGPHGDGPTSTGEVAVSEPEVVEARPARETDTLRVMKTIQGVDLRKLLQDQAEGPSQLAAPVKTLGQSDSQLLALVRIGEELRKAASVDEVCERAVELAMRATTADRGLLALKDGDGFVTRAERVRNGEKLVDGAVRVSRTFVRRVLQEKQALLAVDAASEIVNAKSVVGQGIRSVVCVPMLDASETVTGFLYLDKVRGGSAFGSRVVDLLCLLGLQAAAEVGRLQMVEQVREEQEQRRTLGRFFSADVVKLIEEESRQGSDLSAVRAQVVTVLFSDIQGFTALSERTEPNELRAFLDVYFDRMAEILVDRWGGTLDKYIGDGMMGLFGAPFSKGPDVDARNAVSAAVNMIEALEKLRKEFPRYADIGMRIGVNSGKMIAGMLGCPRRREYSVLGDAVNVASRLESTGEAGRIQIGETTYVAVKKDFECEPAGERKVKNREQPVRSFWVIRPKK